MVKTTIEQIEEMKRLRADGMLYSEIAEKMGVNSERVGYYINPKTRARKIRNGKRMSKERREQCKVWNKKWRRENPEKYKKSIFFSTMRCYLRKNIITKKEVLDEVNKYTTK